MQGKRWSYVIRIMILIGVIIVVPAVPASFVSVSTGTAVPDNIMLTWNAETKTSFTVTWRMDIDAADAFLQYAEELKDYPFPYDVRSITANVEKRSTDAGDMTIHSATISGLQPGTKYYYRVGYGNIWSTWYTVSTDVQAGESTGGVR